MPCFHFHVHGEPIIDRDGLDLPGLREARLEAVRLTGAMLAAAPETFWDGKEWKLDVCNCEGEVIFGLDLGCHDGERGVSLRDCRRQ